jgi:hypothetical protein
MNLTGKSHSKHYSDSNVTGKFTEVKNIFSAKPKPIGYLRGDMCSLPDLCEGLIMKKSSEQCNRSANLETTRDRSSGPRLTGVAGLSDIEYLSDRKIYN